MFLVVGSPYQSALDALIQTEEEGLFVIIEDNNIPAAIEKAYNLGCACAATPYTEVFYAYTPIGEGICMVPLVVKVELNSRSKETDELMITYNGNVSFAKVPGTLLNHWEEPISC